MNQQSVAGSECFFLTRGTVPPHVDNRPTPVAGKPELREYKAVFVVNDQEVSRFTDEITVNSTPLVSTSQRNR